MRQVDDQLREAKRQSSAHKEAIARAVERICGTLEEFERRQAEAQRDLTRLAQLEGQLAAPAEEGELHTPEREIEHLRLREQVRPTPPFRSGWVPPPPVADRCCFTGSGGGPGGGGGSGEGARGRGSPCPVRCVGCRGCPGGRAGRAGCPGGRGKCLRLVGCPACRC